MIVGYLLAACAALASGTGSVLESIGIRRAGIFGGTSFDLVLLRKQYVYFLGLCADLTGFVLAAAALHLLPLFLVQSVIAFSVGVTALISALLGIRLARLGWIALAVGAAGLVLLGLSAEPTPAHTMPPDGGGSSRRPLFRSRPSVVSGGRCHHRSRRRSWRSPPDWGSAWSVSPPAPCTSRIRPVSSCNRARWPSSSTVPSRPRCSPCPLQRGGATGTTGATAIMFTTTMTVPSLIGLLYLGDQVRPGFASGAVVGFALAVAGAIGAAYYASSSHRPKASDTAEESSGQTRTGTKVPQIAAFARH